MSGRAFRIAVRVPGRLDDLVNGEQALAELDPVYTALDTLQNEGGRVWDFWIGESLDGAEIAPAEPGVSIFMFAIEPIADADVFVLGREIEALFPALIAGGLDTRWA